MSKLQVILLGAVLLLQSNITQAKTPTNEIRCLAETIYHEARGESERGKKAVALVTLNRTRHKRFPSTVCGVVHQKGQYSWVGKGKRIKEQSKFNTIQRLATQIYNDFHRNIIPAELINFKSAIYFSTGGFSGKSYRYIGKIDHHRFYSGK